MAEVVWKWSVLDVDGPARARAGSLRVSGTVTRLALMQCRMRVLSAAAAGEPGLESSGDLSQNQGSLVLCVAGLHLVGTSVV